MSLRDFAHDKHKMVDDTPYGGGAGMVMKPDVVGAAIDAAITRHHGDCLVSLTPRGAPFTQNIAEKLAIMQGLIMLCGRFEGVDERVNAHYQPLELSLGDFILFGGEVAAMAVAEAVIRLLPQVVGNESTHREESFSLGQESTLLLEYPHYTKPPFWKGLGIPEVLTSGHHERIAQWRWKEAERITKERRPDMWERYSKQRDSEG